jgi:hypothetical protein
MTLSTRPEPYIIPSYSLTGDLLSYLNCGRQYRYHNRGALPPSKPVQLWFGQFIHGVMEESYRLWSEQHQMWTSGGGRGPLLDFPWSDAVLEEIEETIITRLRAQGLIARNKAMLELSRRRARTMINTIARHLFLLIDQAEVRLHGIRTMPTLASKVQRADYYEVTGVVDVLTSVRLSQVDPSNLIVQKLLDHPDVAKALSAARQTGTNNPGDFEIIVDYKGMRRPPVDTQGNALLQYEWQLHTYAWLREQQPGAKPVLAGVLLFVNELEQSATDMKDLHTEVVKANPSTTDILPVGADLKALQTWMPHGRGKPLPKLSEDYRLERAFHIVPTPASIITSSLQQFDSVVAEIETSVGNEKAGQTISKSWQARHDQRTCEVCDFKNFCDTSGVRGTPYAP